MHLHESAREVQMSPPLLLKSLSHRLPHPTPLGCHRGQVSSQLVRMAIIKKIYKQ